MSTMRALLSATVMAALVIPASASAQEAGGDARQQEIERVLKSIHWEKGPTKSQVGGEGELTVPEGYVFTGGIGTRKMLELMKNPTNGSELGMLTPQNLAWFVIFEFQSIGYVKDADKEKLDAGDILDSIKKGTEESNKQRAARGWPSINIVGWQTPPFFDKAAKNLQWCIKGASEGHEIVNYNTRLLGRSGVMSANLLVAPAKLEATLPAVKTLLAGYSFKEGKRYAEYKKGDRIAEYGLAALVVGGAAAAAAKLGLFGKLLAFFGKSIKLVIVGAVAVFAAIGAALKRLFGGGKGKPVPPADPPAGPAAGV